MADFLTLLLDFSRPTKLRGVPGIWGNTSTWLVVAEFCHFHLLLYLLRVISRSALTDFSSFLFCAGTR
jgi:hypothetical protein